MLEYDCYPDWICQSGFCCFKNEDFVIIKGEAVYVKIKKPYLDLIKGSGVSVLKFKDKTDGKIRIYDSYLREQIDENEYIYDAEKKSVHYYNEKEGGDNNPKRTGFIRFRC